MFEEFEKIYEGISKDVIRRMWDNYTKEKRSVEKWKDEKYGLGISCKMIFTNATDRTVNRGPTVHIFMGKKTNDGKVYFFPSIPPRETRTAFHAKRDWATMGCGGAMEFYLSGLKDQPWWAVGWKIPYSGANATDSQVATSVDVSKYLEGSHVMGTSSTTFLHDDKYQLDTLVSPGTTAILHIILRKVK